MGFGGGQATLYEAAFRNGAIAGETRSKGLTVELYEMFDTPLAPSFVSVTLERDAPASAASADSRVLSADVAWSTAWGETLVSYWRNVTDADGLAWTQSETYVDASHQVRLGRWRLSMGVDFEEYVTADGGAAAGVETALNALASLAYAAPALPEFRLGIARRSEDAFFDGADPTDRGRRLDLTFKLDLAPYLRSRWDIEQIFAFIEYRRQLGNERIETQFEDATVREGLLASFAMPL